jgi:flagellar hook-basal body complex protein FliE
MAIDGVSAVGAATKSLELTPSGSTGATTATAGTSFVDAIGKAFTDSVASVQGGEAAAIQGLQGGMELAIRDKAVSAYQEISRMAI